MFKNTILIAIFITLSSCYSTRHLEKDDFILRGNNIVVNNQKNNIVKGISKKEIRNIIKQKPNKKIIGFIPFYLFIYNLSNPKKNNWAHSYLRKIGEQPIKLNTFLIEKSINQIQSHLENNGYFTSTVTSSIKYNNRCGIVNYNISTGDSYVIDEINYNTIKQSNQKLYSLIKPNETNIKTGDIFTYQSIDKERERIENILKNNGYYKFSKENIYIEADSSKNKFINLNFIISDSSNRKPITYNTFKVRDIYIHIDSNKGTKDTLNYNGYKFISTNNNHTTFKKLNIINFIKIIPNTLYSKKKTELTYSNLSNIDFFRKISIEFSEEITDSILKCNIFLELPTKMYYSIEAEAKRSSDEGNLGLSSYLQFGNNNLLKGGEKLYSTLKLSLENRQTNIKKTEEVFNTREILYEIGLEIPKLIIPQSVNNRIGNIFDMHTNIKFSASKKQRPDFTSQSISQNIGYKWKTSNRVQHTLNLIELSFSKIGEINSYIQEQINENPFLNEQFEDKFIPAINYTYTYNNQQIYRPSNYSYFRIKLETSGNLFRTISSTIKLNKNDNNNYIVFQNPFSQYLRIDMDFRKFLVFQEDEILAFRIFYGVGYAYGNSQSLPIQKQFFSGGVNSIRAWEAFGLGPGSVTENNVYSTGDIKIEFNIEYRFPFFNALKSAIFIDGGNVWSLQNDTREGSVFEINKFTNQMAIGFGAGLRYDFDFFVIRLDLATKLKDPSILENNGWIKNPLNEKFRYNLAIGYPF